MKKYQLLEKAMRDYPAGTVARFMSAPDVDHISNGVFRFVDHNNDGTLNIVCGAGVNCVYSDGEWAVPVPESILNDKCAIHINNEREFKLLMEHYDSKGWYNGQVFEDRWLAIQYKMGWTRFHHLGYSDIGSWSIIPFADFAVEVGINVPVFVMTGEDGVDLFVGDNGHHVFQGHGSWNYNGTFKITDKLVPIGAKVFSSREAADKWIANANKLKEVIIDYPTIVIKVTSEGFSATSKVDSRQFTFEGEDIISIWRVYQSLKED